MLLVMKKCRLCGSCSYTPRLHAPPGESRHHSPPEVELAQESRLCMNHVGETVTGELYVQGRNVSGGSYGEPR